MQYLFNKSNQAFPFLLMALTLSACGGKSAPITQSQVDTTVPPVTSPTTTPPVVTNPTPTPTSGVRPQVIAGWLDEYSTSIEENVSRNYPELLGLTGTRMKTVCPAWDRLDRGTREKFWSALLWSIAGPESGRNRTVIYRETTMSIDAVTGQQIRSEGLLQLSYVDVPNYRYKGGDISWENDKTMALSDYAKALTKGNPERTILNAYANLNLGTWIIYRQLVFLHPAEMLETALGRYWHTMRVTSSSFSKVISNLKTRIPACSG